jgi:hypothetical protein
VRRHFNAQRLLAGRLPEAGWRFAFALALAGLAGPSPLVHRLADANLPFHLLIEHTLLLVAGVLLAESVRATRPGATIDRVLAVRPGPLLGAAGVVLALWHVPAVVGWAATSEPGHAAMHLALIGAGALLMIAIPRAGPALQLAALGLWQATMGVLAVLLYSGAVAYPAYSAEDSVTVGLGMLALMMPSLLAVLALPTLAPRLARTWRPGAARRGTLALGATLCVSFALAAFL